MKVNEDSIEVGGQERLPEYTRSYLEAARRLLASAGEDLGPIALPLAYLQRHCLELILKDIHLAASFLSAAKKMAAEGMLATPERPEATHNLVELTAALT